MPLNTIVVNQGDFQTNVPEGNTVQDILPSWDVRTEDEKLGVIVDKQEPPCQPQPEVQVTELKPESGPDSEHLKCTIEIIPTTPNTTTDTESTTIADTTTTSTATATGEETSGNKCSRAITSSSTQVPSNFSPGRSSSADRSMEEQEDMSTASSVPVVVSMEVMLKQGVTTLSSSTTLTNDVSHGCDLGFNVASNKGWGIPKGLGLRGGSPGLNSLNNGTSGWGPVPQQTGNAPTGWGAPASQTSSAGNPNNGGVIGGTPGQVGSGGPSSSGSIGPNGASSASNSSSSPPGSGGLNNPGQTLPSANNNHPGGSNQWASTSPNRNTSQNTNGQPNISGSQINNNPSGNATTQGPPGNAMQMGNQNMGNNPNPNNSMNQASLGQNPVQSAGVGSGNSGVITNAGSSSWAQAAGKSLVQAGGSNTNNSSNMNNNAGNPNPGNSAIGGSATSSGSTHTGPASQTGSTSSSSVTSKQIEQLNNMREALFSHDGWGGQNVNQDSSWDIPSSPEPAHKDLGMGPAAGASGSGGTAVWKPNVNNGTDLWEANLRNGGAPPPAPPASKTPWGHTPTTNIGGTWGEEDDTPDQSNVWTAPPANNAPGPNNQQQVSNNSGGATGQMQWGMNNGPQQTQNNAGGGMWNAPMKKDNGDWGGSGRVDGNRHTGHVGGDNRGVGMVGNENRPTARGWDDRNSSQMNNGSVDANPGMWNKPQPPPQQPPQQSQWGGGGPGPGPGPVQGHANMGMGIGGGHGAHSGMKDSIGSKQSGGSGWDEVSPPTQRRPVPNIPNYDDGTSLWGSPITSQQQPQQAPQPRGMPPNRGMPNKMDNPMGWGGHGQTRNGWQGPDGPGPDGGFNPGGGGGGGGWNDEPSKNIGSWGEPQMSQNNSWNKPKTPTNPNSGWGDDGLVDVSNWGAPPKPTKEDLEQLNFRSSNINLNDALDHLDPMAPGGVGIGGGRGPMDGPWGGGGGAGPLGPQRRGPPPGPVEDHFDLGLGVGPGGPLGMGPPPQPRGGFPPNPSGFSGANSIMNNVGNAGATLNQGLLARLLNSQQQPNNQPHFNPQGRVPANNAISPSQLQLLVQQIRMAVQAGYLSSQILSHPLPQQSLYLLNNLLQAIKVFHQLTETQRQIGKSNSSAALQISVQITKTKQTIANLHNQIAAQQALHAKQQQQQPPHHPLAGAGGPGNPGGPNNEFFKQPPQVLGDNRGVSSSGSSMMDPFMALPNNFGSDVGMKEGGQHQTSKLGQWTKLPSLDKEDGNSVSEPFSRAPGQQSNNSATNLLKNNPSLILGQSDNTWSTVAPRSGSDGWPTDHAASSQNVNNSGLNQGDDSSKPGGNVNMNAEAWPADLVPEFEPGKPWKGTQMIKSVDDDPTLTPGSVVRSPLSLAAIKDSDFLSKNSTSTISSMPSDSLVSPLISLQSSSNPWSFTPTSSGSTSIANSLAKLNNTKWDDMGRRDLWDYNNPAGGAPGSRPPPGLPKKAPGPNSSVPAASGNVTPGTNSNSFNSFRNNSTNSWGGPNPGGSGGLGNSHAWLLLRNLTPQIDGSTLKTLCCQHGPLQKFHLYTSHGVALVKYSSSEEAAKAQRALNNCLLNNTTILAETAGEDVHNLIQGFNSASVNNQTSAPANSGFMSGGNSNDNPWGVMRDSSPLWSSNPWGSSGLDAPDRATPSSLLPGDLLGGESA